MEMPQMVAKNEWIWIETYGQGWESKERDASGQETKSKQVNPNELDL